MRAGTNCRGRFTQLRWGQVSAQSDANLFFGKEQSEYALCERWSSTRPDIPKESLAIKFSGDQLTSQSVPIYELGDTLVAIQRILHKAFLFQNERLQKHARLTQAERKKIALQIPERRKSSDLYALIPFVSDPLVQQQISNLLKIGLGALAKYSLKKISSEPGQKKQDASVVIRDIEGSSFVGAIYAETVQITNHINNIGGVESIEVIPGASVTITPITLTAETQEYVREVANQRYRGDSTQILGKIKKLAPDRLTAEVWIAPNRVVKVGLSEEDFHCVRYRTQSEQTIRFKGRPIYRLGSDSSSYQEFEAESVQAERVRSDAADSNH